MVNDPGEAMKKTQVIKGISNEFASFAQIEARRDMSWAEYCASIRDQATQFADISLFRDKHKEMIAAKRARLQSSDRSGGGDEPTEDHVNFVSDRGRMKRRGKDESGANSALRCWSCVCKGHKSFECPLRDMRKKRHRDDKPDYKLKHKKLQVRVDDSEASGFDGSVIDLLITVASAE